MWRPQQPQDWRLPRSQQDQLLRVLSDGGRLQRQLLEILDNERDAATTADTERGHDTDRLRDRDRDEIPQGGVSVSGEQLETFVSVRRCCSLRAVFRLQATGEFEWQHQDSARRLGGLFGHRPEFESMRCDDAEGYEV